MAALLGPFWSSAVPGVDRLTVGRVLLLAVGLVLVYDLLRTGRRAPPSSSVQRLFVALLGAMIGWIALNAALWGCNCAGTLGGASELALAGAFAMLACRLDPARAPAVLIAAAVGVGLGGVMALLGIRDLNSALVEPAEAGYTRLDGVYGNPNFLAYAVAFSVPAGVGVLVLSPWRARIAASIALAVVAVVLALTLSRGGMLAAVAGGIIAAGLAVRSRRRAFAVAAVATALVALVALAAYPLLDRERLEANFPVDTRASLVRVDGSGWDPRAAGLVPRGGAVLANTERGALVISSATALQGASLVLGSLQGGETYTLNFEARSLGRPFDLNFGLEDNQLGRGPVLRLRRLTASPRSLRLRWRPTGDAPDARFYVWQNKGRTRFEISSASLQRSGGPDAPVSRQLPLRLKGQPAVVPDRERLRGAERALVRSRLIGVELAVEAFRGEPLTGIGWERFPAYAQRRSTFGQLPTHNEYMRFLAELGLPGLVLLLGLGGLVAQATAACRDRRLRAIAGGMLVTGAVGMLFVNGLGVSSASLPFALAAGTVIASAARSARHQSHA